MRSHQTYTGPALFSYGFRPMFLLAGCFAALVIPLWMVVWTGRVMLDGPFTPTDWHIHELLFGYTSAVVAGFLFTAIPNWTGRMPTRGWPLLLLAALWMAGRLAVAGLFGLSPLAVMALDCAFLLAIGAMVSVEIIAGRNWSNLRVVVPVLLYLAANITFHLEVIQTGTAGYGRRLGFAMVVLLIGLIGGRIIPSFTRNWLAKAGPGPLPLPFGRFDAASLVLMLAALLCWVAFPEAQVTGIALILAGAGQILRLARWRGWRVWRSAILLMLHLAYAFIPAGLVALGMAVLGNLPIAVALHLLGIGAIGGMTLAVMSRASLGHTGRELKAGRALTLAFVCVLGAALVRVTVPSEPGLWLAATLWIAGFALFAVRLAPVLTLPNPARRNPTPHPR
ncbi:NnrS family protein [Pseudotabrizicola alkalilacus]|uniref:NnrS family protein n=1 Tax=Pseudotabrizicola alkalilacus TaxID=2305252 RepID=A0A411Z790_9RHOB|nr:NnrS family protein [Pseudotabrizicola alkalilacus]RGP38980.1 NnrS family protein [Pseudotabrizicola alkalilacus]